MAISFESTYARVRDSISRAQAAERAGQMRPAAEHYSRAARQMQQTFESLPTTAYAQAEVQRLAEETAALRKLTAQSYSAAEDLTNASYELSHGARCLETYAQTLLLQHTDVPAISLARLLDKAIVLRGEAIDKLRGDPDHAVNLAFELSYLSKALSFLIRNFPIYQTPEKSDKMIACRSEATLLFESGGRMRDAFFEYRYLAKLLLEKGKADPAAFMPAIFSALRAVEICEAAKFDLVLLPALYRLAASGYRHLAGATTDGYRGFYREQARELELMVLEVGDRIDDLLVNPDGRKTSPTPD